MTAGAVPVAHPRPKRLMWLLGVGLLLLLGGAFLWWWQGRRVQVTYITLPASQGSIVNTVNAAGTIEPVKSVNLGFKNSGIIKAIYVKPGDVVKAGQVLASQDTADLEAQLAQARANLNNALAKLQLLEAGPLATDIAQAEANVESARAAYNNAQATVERDQALYQAGALSKAELDNAITNRDSAAAKLRQAQAALEALKNGNRPEDIAAARAQVEAARVQVTLAQSNLDSAQLRAPWDGIISAVNGEVGYRVGSGTNNESFLTLITPALQLRAQVNEADINKVKIGQKATFTVNALPGREMSGQVAWIAPQATTVSNVQLYDVVISLDPNLPLKAGMTANVNIITARKDNVLTVSRTAIAFAASYQNSSNKSGSQAAGTPAPGSGSGNSGNREIQRGGQGSASPATGTGAGESEAGATEPGTSRAVVLVLEEGRPVARQIITGLSDERNVEVVRGLKPGEAVIIGTSTPGKPATGTTARSPLNPTPIQNRQPNRPAQGRQ
ncbi:Uncharacterized [Moorella glycerini]|uniref:Macrolide export protein MacA n=1 Tax=Neomoorella stamsii TaxID=1266720 RepID=A0A9X7J663_9FIRM|nr:MULTISPECIES: HlyD family efflux transporter periplasmic adaptor subunit [Moorella]PRR76743.1 Macrolide export protein MacA [Moorella stamsii]CEP66723.1 Uncharacterized [Moorella glycerini]